GVTHHRLGRFLQRRRSQPVGSGGSDAQRLLAEEPGPPDGLEAAWEQEFQQQLFRLASARVQENFAPQSWQAFWKTAVEGRPAAEVAAELGMSVGAVYVARSRVLARVAEQVRQLEAE